jgi:hypothetical protein
VVVDVEEEREYSVAEVLDAIPDGAVELAAEPLVPGHLDVEEEGELVAERLAGAGGGIEQLVGGVLAAAVGQLQDLAEGGLATVVGIPGHGGAPFGGPSFEGTYPRYVLRVCCVCAGQATWRAVRLTTTRA